MRTVLSGAVSIVLLVVLAAGCRDARSPLAPGQSSTPASSAVTLASLAIVPGEISGGSPAVGTATLSGPAPAAGATVALSSDSAAASVPVSIAVSPGETAATFAVTTKVVTTATETTITGSLGGISRTATLRVGTSAAPSEPGGPVAAFEARHDDVIGGDDTQGTITLAAPAPAGGTTIRLSSSNPAVVDVPDAVTIAARARSAAFKISTRPVAAEQSVTLTLTLAAPGIKRAAATMQFVLRVVPSVPVLTSIAPAQGVKGTTASVTLTGTGFTAGSTIAVSGAGVTASDVVVASLTSLSATLAIDASAATGARTVTVTTTGGTSGGQTFTVTASNAAPVAAHDSYATTEDTALTVAAPGVLANDTDADGSALTASAVSAPSNGSLTLNANGSFTYTPNADFNGTDSFTYRASDGSLTSNTATVTVTVAAANDPPVLTSLTPGQGAWGTSVGVTLSGTGFISGASVAVSGAGVTVSDVVVASGTSITATFTIAAGAATGARTVTVTTAEGTSGAQTFTVDLAAPTLTGISPASAAQGATVAVTLTGTNFVDGASVSVSGAGATATAVVVNATTITAELTVSGTAPTGARTVTVTTVAGTSGAQAFTVVLPPPPTLSVFPVTPTTSLDGPTIGVTIAGTNFVAGATDVTVSGGITVSNVVVTSATAITADFSNLTMSSSTTFDVTVTTSGGSDTETVTSGAPFTSDHSFEGFENAKCVQISLSYEDTPGSETEMAIAQLPAVGTLFEFDATQLNNVGDPIAASAPLPNDSRFCFVPVAHDHSVPAEAVYTTVLARTQSRTVVGTIERTRTIVIYITPVFFPPTLRGKGGGG